MGPEPTPADCSYDCGTLTQTIVTESSGTGAHCPSHASTYECQLGDGQCGGEDGGSSINTGGASSVNTGDSEGTDLSESMMYIILIGAVGLLFIIAVGYLIYGHYKTRKALDRVGRFTRVELQDLDEDDDAGNLFAEDDEDNDEKDSMLGGLSWSPGFGEGAPVDEDDLGI
jgi:hypothetical protein